MTRLESKGGRVAFAAAAGVALAGALWGRLADVGPAELERRERRMREEGERALEADARTLLRVSARLQASAEFGAIADGGGAELRPSRLFSVLSQALPEGSGWGAVYYDRTGRAVAWGGDAAGFEAERGVATTGLIASFRVTQLTLGWVTPRGEGSTRHGTLVVSRRYPTGILRPDLVEFFGLPSGPTMLRLRARASDRRDRLLALFVERAPEEIVSEDVGRVRARPFALAAAALLLVLGLLARQPAIGIVAARLVLLLGTPRAESGSWRLLFPASEVKVGLAGTPADLFLTGVAVVLVLRVLAARITAARERPPLIRAVMAVAAAGLALVPFLLGRRLAMFQPDLFDSWSLVPNGLAEFLGQTGAIAMATSALGLAAFLLEVAASPRRPRLLAAFGGVLLLVALLSAGRLPLVLPATAAAFLFSAALASRLGGTSRDLLARAATAVFLVAAACLIFGAGLSEGKARRLDDALEAAEDTEGEERTRGVSRLAERWEERVRNPALEPWLPAGDRTLGEDLARALWVRGADADFPEIGDTLKVFRTRGDELSSFGVMRPGTDAGATSWRTSLPVGFPAEWRHVPYPRDADREPLLSAVASRDLPDRIPVERVEYDAAGRSTRSRGAERAELPRAFAAAARRTGLAVGNATSSSGVRRLRVRARPPGFLVFAAPGESPLTSLGAAAAAGEAALIVLLPLLVGGPLRWEAGRGFLGGTFFGTFRARLVLLVLFFGALPLAGSIVVVRVALERHSAQETVRHARGVLTESRRVLTSTDAAELNRAAAVVGTDLLLYRDGRLVSASRAIPVAAEIATERLNATVAEALADGRSEATVAARRAEAGGLQVVEAAETVSAEGSDALAVVVVEDEAARAAVDGLVLFTVAVALGAFGLGGRAALALGKPIQDLIEGTEKIGSGASAPPIERPGNVDLARLVDAFTAMAGRVKERTESLARERASAVGLLSNLTAAVVLFRMDDGAVILSNPAADRILPGGSLSERLSNARWEPLRAALSEAERRRGAHYERRVAVPEGGRERLWRVVVVRLPSDGSESRAILLLEDLTDFLRADRLSAWVEAARAIAHDIKNPLTPIRLAAERLLRLEGRAEAVPQGAFADAGANILRQVGILTERIGRLARFSDLSGLAREPLDRGAVAALLSEVASDYAEHERVEVTVDAPPDLYRLEADRALLRDALTNLVVNALEALGQGGGHVRLSAANMALPGGGAGVRFVCEDDGPGVSEGVTGHLFDPAFSTKSRGSGMGLAAVRRVVERHSGTVFAHPREGGGLVIGFTLPAVRV